MNQGTHLYAVSARLMEAAECAGELAAGTTQGPREQLHTAMKKLGEAERLWGSLTTAMPPSHEYVTATRELHVALTDATDDGPRPRGINEITESLDIGRALADLRYAACDVADLARDVQHVPDPLLRSGLLFAPASKLTPSVERLRDRAAGRYVPVLPDEVPDLARAARSAATQADLAVRTLDPALSQASPLTIAGTGAQRTASVPEL